MYDYIRTLGEAGQTVATAIHPYLVDRYGMTGSDGQRFRIKGMRELTDLGWVRRHNPRSRNVDILC